MFEFRTTMMRALVLLLGIGYLAGSAQADVYTVSSTSDDGSPGTLRWAIEQANGNAGADTIVFDLGGPATITLTGELPVIDDDLLIDGPGADELTIDGDDQFRLLFVNSGTANIRNLTLANGRAQGGKGGVSRYGGGGGGAAGMGAALFVNAGSVTVSHVSFDGNVAQGGDGGRSQYPALIDGGGGGGGLGGDGQHGVGDFGDGGNGNGGAGGPLGGTGGAGSFNSAGGAGGPGAGGGGGGWERVGGSGGFGGGGGGGGVEGDGGSGGFGGGGGGGGESMSTGGAGGTFAGDGGSSTDWQWGAGGGGGAGLGGAVFVRGGTVALYTCAFNRNSASGGAGGIAHILDKYGEDGQGKGGAIFVHDDATVLYANLTFGANADANFAGDAANTATDNDDVYGTLSLAGPVTQASDVWFSGVQTTQATINWTRGDGEACVVFIKQVDSGSPDPVDSSTYVADTAFGEGDEISSSGWYCVYNGTGTAVTVTGLTTGTTYRLMVMEYDGQAGGELYLTGTAEANPNNFTTLSLPVVATAQVDGVTDTTAFSGGEITEDGGAAVTARGVCWNTAGSPTTADSHTSDGAGAGVFNSSLTGLTPDTTYHVRAFAVNAAGTAYGQQESFTTDQAPAPPGPPDDDGDGDGSEPGDDDEPGDDNAPGDDDDGDDDDASDDGGDDPADDEDPIDTPSAPNLQLTVSAQQDQVTVGQTASFLITLENTGDGSAEDVQVTVHLPDNADFVFAELLPEDAGQNAGLLFEVAENQVTLFLGTLPGGAKLTVQLVLLARSSGPLALSVSATSANSGGMNVTADAEIGSVLGASPEVQDEDPDETAEDPNCRILCGRFCLVPMMLTLIGLSLMRAGCRTRRFR